MTWEQRRTWLRRQALWILFGLGVVVNVWVILDKELDAVAATGLVSASAAAYSAVVSAVATRRAVVVSEKTERAAERATQALSRALLPLTINVLSGDSEGQLQLTLSAGTVPTEPSATIFGFLRVAPDGRRVRLPVINTTDTGFITFGSAELPKSPTVGQFRTWATGFEVEFTDPQGLADWAVPLNNRLGPEPDEAPLPFHTFSGDIIGMHGMMRPLKTRT